MTSFAEDRHEGPSPKTDTPVKRGNPFSVWQQAWEVLPDESLQVHQMARFNPVVVTGARVHGELQGAVGASA